MKLKQIIGILLIILAVSPAFFLFKSLLQTKDDANDSKFKKEALFWQVLEDGKVQCNLCPNKCILAPGQWGLCKARKNIDGKLYSMVYGKVTTSHVDPIEKKPFYHFMPGRPVYSLAASGCNLDCQFCQNWDIAKRFPDDLAGNYMTPRQVIEEAGKSGSKIIAFTYNEPVVWYEYMLDIAKLAKEEGLKTVVVTSGYINQEPLKELLPYISAIKVDLKGFSDDYYQKVVGGKLQPVLETLQTLKESGVHYEIVTLLVTDKNDSEEEIKKECLWIKENLGENVPLHFSRFHPDYKMTDIPATPIETIKKARKICLDIGLKYVYTGNMPDIESSTTFCPENNKPLIIRKGYFIQENSINENGESNECPGIKIPGIWK